MTDTGTGIRALVAGGGTGGHLFPGIALAEAILARLPGSEVLFVSTGKHVDSTALVNRNFPVTAIRCEGLKGRGPIARLGALLMLPRALWEALAIVRRFKPDLVFGVGGYVTGPVILAARMLGRHTCIHEQNSVPGLTNRTLGRIVDRVFLSLPGSEAYFPAVKTVLTGNPVRRELLALAGAERKPAEGPLTLLVIGGSQGAHRVNTLIVGALDKYRNQLPQGFQIIHQTGVADEEMVRGAYARLRLDARVSAFFHNMEDLYRDADVVVARAGATTLAELMVAAKPAILIPFPYATDNHQEKNARYLADNGAAVLCLQKDLTEMRLGKEIMRLLSDPALRERLGACAGRLAQPRATEAILEECLRLLDGRRGRSMALQDGNQYAKENNGLQENA